MRAYLLLLLLLAVPPVLAAQTPEKSVFLIRRGNDTIATEALSRTPTELTGTITFHRADPVSEWYHAVVGPDATVPLLEVNVRQGVDTGLVKAHVAERTRAIFRGDSVAVDDMTDQGLDTRVLPTHSGALPYLNLSFGLLEQAIRRAAVVGGDSVKVPFFNMNGGARGGEGVTVVGTVSRIGADSVALELGSVEYRMRVDAGGRLLGGGIAAQGLSFERE
ncbi:MAG TPA: hypothetical protein VF830_08310 [Gemmatimonadales bacterium]